MTLFRQGLKAQIAANFTASAPHYDHYALLQRRAAQSLAERLHEIKEQIPVGPVLEFGCGTGALSKELATMLPDRRLTFVDLAPGMIEQNRSALMPLIASNPHRVEWQVADAETLKASNHYALITSSLTLQWFDDLTGSLNRLCTALIPGGILLCSYLGELSFPEWRQTAAALGLTCTANPLPKAKQFHAAVSALGHRTSTREEMIQITYPTVLDFFRSLKKTGTSTPIVGNRLTSGQMTRLINGWQRQAKNGIIVTYQINTLMVQP